MILWTIVAGTILNIYLAVALFTAAYIVFFVSSRGSASYMKLLVATSVGILIYTYGYMMELNSRTIDTALFWNQVQYFSLPFINALWVLLALYYTGYLDRHGAAVPVLLLALPVATFVMRLTNRWHTLFYGSFSMGESGGLTILSLERGPWYYVHIGYAAVLGVLAAVLFISSSRQASSFNKTKYRILTIATLLPMVASLLLASESLDIGLDYVALVMPIVLVLAVSAIVRYDFLEISSLALDHIFRSSGTGMLVVSINDRIVDLNPEAKRVFGALGIRAIERHVSSVHEDNPEFYEWITDRSERTFACEIDGKQEHLARTRTALTNRSGDEIGSVFTIRNVTADVEQKASLETMASTDELSRLFNRREFFTSGRRKLEATGRDQTHVALLMIDIDHFKSVNDTYGHQTGDEVIVSLADCIKQRFRGDDVAARVGGEEFAVLMVGIRNRELAVERAEQLRRAVEEGSLIADHPEVTITVSIGVAFPDGDTDLDALVRRADEKLYEAKRSGRNRVCHRRAS